MKNGRPRGVQVGVTRMMVLGYIRGHQKALGRPPSIREIGDALGISSTSAVVHHLQVLVSEGSLEHLPRRGYLSKP